jgi:hypothetical protein
MRSPFSSPHLRRRARVRDVAERVKEIGLSGCRPLCAAGEKRTAKIPLKSRDRLGERRLGEMHRALRR